MAASIGEIFRIARECRGWSQRELEARTGVSNPALSQIETGKIKDPCFSVVVTVADALGISLDILAAEPRQKNQEKFAKRILRSTTTKGISRG